MSSIKNLLYFNLLNHIVTASNGAFHNLKSSNFKKDLNLLASVRLLLQKLIKNVIYDTV